MLSLDILENNLGTVFQQIFRIFLKTKRDLELVSLSYFLHDFWREIFMWLCSINWPNNIVWLRLQ